MLTLDQKEEKKYTAELVAEGIPQKQIRSYGFAYDAMKVLIGEAK